MTRRPGRPRADNSELVDFALTKIALGECSSRRKAATLWCIAKNEDTTANIGRRRQQLYRAIPTNRLDMMIADKKQRMQPPPVKRVRSRTYNSWPGDPLSGFRSTIETQRQLKRTIETAVQPFREFEAQLEQIRAIMQITSKSLGIL